MSQPGDNYGKNIQKHRDSNLQYLSCEQQEHQQRHGLTDEERFKKNLEVTRSAVRQKDEEWKSIKDSLAEMEAFYKVKLRGEGLAEMETFYKEKLEEERSARKEIEEDFLSFKNRVAPDLALSRRAGNTENMNSPVSESKLKKMYDKLKLHQWPKIKDHLKSEGAKLEKARAYIQVEELRQSVIQSLQLAVYHSRTDDKTPVPQHGDHYLQKIMEKFELECYWLGCLMALNNPPLQPDWENHIPGMDEWDIFPKEIRAVSAF
ncbi:uncharacterized protein LOC108874504 isoform X4 [Lates calcarifer]|uniref:Uncharacterized protein LOC108874504 isoform X4 n=1 Tax=Lates calcarifer TaxID=8187 RepID=A0AAJ8DN30_LATCA|nr:uncharacterized protein LOC108874504 isoform X4 [Lates calcarifer]